MGNRIVIIQGHPDPAGDRLCHALAWIENVYRWCVVVVWYCSGTIDTYWQRWQSVGRKGQELVGPIGG
jgi:hypothetical protein